MILRVVRGSLPSNRLAVLAESFATDYVADARSRPGLIRFHVGVRPVGDAHEIVAATYWNSIESTVIAFGDLSAARTLGNLSRIAEFSGAEYYEVDEALVRPSRNEPIALRIAAGRLEAGGDVELQEKLRHRLPLLDDAMTHAYVGRRLVGSLVEVAFLSTWAGPPPAAVLDQPLWPDIAARYEQFEIRTYMLLRDRTWAPSVDA